MLWRNFYGARCSQPHVCRISPRTPSCQRAAEDRPFTLYYTRTYPPHERLAATALHPPRIYPPPHLSAARIVALFPRSSSSVSVSARLQEARFVALQESIDSEASLSFSPSQEHSPKASSLLPYLSTSKSSFVSATATLLTTVGEDERDEQDNQNKKVSM